MMRPTIIGLFVFMLSYHAGAQDPNFSQFFASPLTLNPALTGKFDGMLRVAGNYRNQWPTIFNAFRTGTVSADFQLLSRQIPLNDQFGMGFTGMYDENGNGVMKNSYYSASLAYHKGLDEIGYHHLGVGLSGTFAQRNLNPGKLIFEDQLTSLGFTGNTAELLSGNQNINLNYFSLNAGILYSGSITDDDQFYAGVSVYHVNRPEKSFQGNGFLAKERFTLHGGGYFPVAEGTTLYLSGNCQWQNGASELIAGGTLGRTVKEDKDQPVNVYAGGWFRVGDAVIPYVGMDISSFRIGVSYDINVSGLAQASRRQGGMELSLIYVQRYADKTRRYLPCPTNF